MTPIESLVDSYLGAVAWAAGDLPPLPASVSTVAPRRSRPGAWIAVAVAVVLGVVLVTCIAGVLGLVANQTTSGGVERQPVPAEVPTRSPNPTG